MKLPTPLRFSIPRMLLSLLALPMLIGLSAPAALAQSKLKPAAATTLDVCQEDATGEWRYSGVVSVRNGAATDTSVVRIGYWIQNRISGIAYNDAFEAQPVADAVPPARLTPAKVIAFSVDGPPLLLGSLRNNARIRIYDPLNAAAPAISLDPTFELTAAVCGCGQPKGCVRTQGYWGSKPGVVWPAGYSRTASFFSSGLTWQQVLDTPPRGGNGYLILAHQTSAAVLNQASAASVPASVQTVIQNAATWFASGVNLESCTASGCEIQKAWAGILDTYNNGEYPGAPRHCPD